MENKGDLKVIFNLEGSPHGWKVGEEYGNVKIVA
jgi:hypothetical protein